MSCHQDELLDIKTIIILKSTLFTKKFDSWSDCVTAVADSKFESFLSELASKCNLKQEKLAELIQQKRASVGDGYLTDQGALFLVAADSWR